MFFVLYFDFPIWIAVLRLVLVTTYQRNRLSESTIDGARLMAQAISLDSKFDVRVSTFGTSNGILIHAEKIGNKSLNRKHWAKKNVIHHTFLLRGVRDERNCWGFCFSWHQCGKSLLYLVVVLRELEITIRYYTGKFCKLIQVNGLYSANRVCTGQEGRLILKTFAPYPVIKFYPSTFYTRKSKRNKEKILKYLSFVLSIKFN